MPTISENRLIHRAKAAVVHKVIDITPEPVAPAPRPFVLRQKMAILSGCGLAFAAVISFLAFPHSRHPAAAAAQPSKAPSQPQKPVVVAAPANAPVPIALNLATAVEQGIIDCSWRGNGRDRLMLTARNLTGQQVRAFLPAGQLLASADSTVATVRSHQLELAPRVMIHQDFATVATSSANRVGEADFHLTAGSLPEIDKLLAYAAAHPEISPGALQTAALILAENLPLASFAKFNELTGGVALLPDAKDFKAETVDIVSALTIVKELGVNRPLAVTLDPQLRIEAMIDPAAHDLAARYYGIDDQWAYWKHELLEGDPSTRHYALYGIARFYPAVALRMMPSWARQQSMSLVFRLSAVQALAQTEKADAIPILRELEHEFGGTSELGRAAHLAANYLDEQMARSSKAASLSTAAIARN